MEITKEEKQIAKRLIDELKKDKHNAQTITTKNILVAKSKIYNKMDYRIFKEVKL